MSNHIFKSSTVALIAAAVGAAVLLLTLLTIPTTAGAASDHKVPAIVTAERFGKQVKEAVKPQGPFKPVKAAVDYGSAEAAFGNARGRPHEGQDIFAPAGTPVIAPDRAVVLETGGGDDRGNWAALYDPKRELTYVYFHMVAPAKVSAGEKLDPGRKVGEVGCTGSCWGDHLHFEVREGKDPYATPIDPLPLLEKWKSYKG